MSDFIISDLAISGFCDLFSCYTKRNLKIKKSQNQQFLLLHYSIHPSIPFPSG